MERILTYKKRLKCFKKVIIKEGVKILVSMESKSF